MTASGNDISLFICNIATCYLYCVQQKAHFYTDAHGSVFLKRGPVKRVPGDAGNGRSECENAETRAITDIGCFTTESLRLNIFYSFISLNMMCATDALNTMNGCTLSPEIFDTLYSVVNNLAAI